MRAAPEEAPEFEGRRPKKARFLEKYGAEMPLRCRVGCALVYSQRAHSHRRYAHTRRKRERWERCTLVLEWAPQVPYRHTKRANPWVPRRNERCCASKSSCEYKPQDKDILPTSRARPQQHVSTTTAEETSRTSPLGPAGHLQEASHGWKRCHCHFVFVLGCFGPWAPEHTDTLRARDTNTTPPKHAPPHSPHRTTTHNTLNTRLQTGRFGWKPPKTPVCAQNGGDAYPFKIT